MGTGPWTARQYNPDSPERLAAGIVRTLIISDADNEYVKNTEYLKGGNYFGAYFSNR
jgi:hypothetical protein